MTGMLYRILRKLKSRIIKPKLVFVDVSSLYKNTLCSQLNYKVRPWLFTNNTFKALEHRRNFAEEYLNCKCDFNFEDTEYYLYIKNYIAEGFQNGHDGSKLYAMTNPSEICTRYMSLIDSIIKNIEIYNSLTKENLLDSFNDLSKSIIDFERDNSKEVYYFATGTHGIQKENQQYLKADAELLNSVDQRLIGHLVPSALRDGNNYLLINGNHRLALFTVLHEKGLFTNKFPIFAT
jgi:hypothetical protein